jgi:uncharacterized protein YjiS (DUF1127 family)
MHTVSFEAAGTRRRWTGPGSWVLRALHLLAAADARHRDAGRLAALPNHLLADMGLTRDAVRVPRPTLDAKR